MKKFAPILIAAALLIPAFASAQTGSALPAPNVAYAQTYVTTIIDFINQLLVPLLIAIAFIMFLWGVANAYILHPGDEEAVKQGHRYILWGIIGFVVIFSLWGLVALVGNTLGLGAGGTHPGYPTL